MEIVQGFTRRQEIEKVPSAEGLAGWVVGALQGRVRIKWRGTPRGSTRQLQLLESLSLGGKRQVMLIDCEGEHYLVGCGSDAVSSIVKVAPVVADLRSTVKSVKQTWL